MATQQPTKTKERKQLQERRFIVAIVAILFFIGAALLWILNSQDIIQGSWSTILLIIFTVLGVVVGLFQWLFPISSMPTQEHHTNTSATLPAPQIIVHVPITQPLQEPPPTVKTSYRGIVGIPPPTDLRTIQQREKAVKDVYAKLTQSDITAIALTGIGGVGKSTLAALVYNDAEEQRRSGNGPFTAEAIWLSVDSSVTLTDLAGNLFEALGKPVPDFSNLAPHNQAVVLFNTLNMVAQTRLIIIDQFENLLDWETGHALVDRPGVGEWLDIINSRQCSCRVLLTSRPWPQGTREYPPTYMQEYAVEGLDVVEGMELLCKQAVEITQATDAELRTAVIRCNGHAFSLTLLASLLRRNRGLSPSTLFKDEIHARLWIGDIARNLLDYIYIQQLDQAQRELLKAFSVYREAVPLEAALALIDFSDELPRTRILSALNVLLTQHLLQTTDGRYRLHAIVADYVQDHFDGNGEQANRQAVVTAHSKAAKYYSRLTELICPPREQRHHIGDVQPLIEGGWQLCQAEQWQNAYDLIEREGIFVDLRLWGENAILLELSHLLLPSDKWHPSSQQTARFYGDLGEVYRVLGKIVSAQEYLERALRLFQETEDRKEEGGILTNLGRVYYEQGYKARAKEHFERALKIQRGVGDRAGEARTLNYLGRLYDRLEQMERGRVCYQEALQIYREIEDRRGEGWVLCSLGNLYNAWVPSAAQKEQALKYCEEALRILRKVGDREMVAWTLTYLGRACNAVGEYEQARKHYEEALQIHREVGNRRGEGWNLYNLGRNLADIGDNEQALRCYEQALRIRIEVGDQLGEGRSLKNVARVYNMQGELEQATKCLKQALRINEEVGDHEGKARTLQTLGLLFSQQRRYDVALASLLFAQHISGEIKSPYGNEIRKQIEELQKEMGEEQYDVLLMRVEPQAPQIVEQALQNGL